VRNAKPDEAIGFHRAVDSFSERERPPTAWTRLRPRVGAAIAIVALGLNLRSQTLLGPTPYLSFVDSPFNPLQTSGGFAYFHLETFEDGLLNTPGVSANTGSVRGISKISIIAGSWELDHLQYGLAIPEANSAAALAGAAALAFTGWRRRRARVLK